MRQLEPKYIILIGIFVIILVYTIFYLFREDGSIGKGYDEEYYKAFSGQVDSLK